MVVGGGWSRGSGGASPAPVGGLGTCPRPRFPRPHVPSGGLGAPQTPATAAFGVPAPPQPPSPLKSSLSCWGNRGRAPGLGSAAAREQTLSPGCLFPKRGSLFVSLIGGFFPMHMHAPVGPGKAPLENQPGRRGAGANPTPWGNTSRFPASGQGFCCSPKTPRRAPSRALGCPQPRRAAGRRWRHGRGGSQFVYWGVFSVGACTPVRLARCGDGAEGAAGCAQGGQESGLRPAGFKYPVNFGASH